MLPNLCHLDNDLCRAQAAPLRRRCPCTQARIFSDEKDERWERRQGSIEAPMATNPHYLTECVYLPGNQPKG